MKKTLLWEENGTMFWRCDDCWRLNKNSKAKHGQIGHCRYCHEEQELYQTFDARAEDFFKKLLKSLTHLYK